MQIVHNAARPFLSIYFVFRNYSTNFGKSFPILKSNCGGWTISEEDNDDDDGKVREKEKDTKK
jgi:hypothetical protein